MLLFIVLNHLSYKTTFSLSPWWPLNTGLIVYVISAVFYLDTLKSLLCPHGDLLIHVWLYVIAAVFYLDTLKSAIGKEDFDHGINEIIESLQYKKLNR